VDGLTLPEPSSDVDEDPLAGAGASVAPDVPPPVVPSSGPPDAGAAVVLARRSFFAQPDPLKWTAGAAIALRTRSDPQAGQLDGGAA
jgi:hypothetical protein